MMAKPKCEECGTELPANASQGLCAQCLINVGLRLAPEPRSTLHSVPEESDAVPPAGEQIGPYKLLQKLGEGGCGVVYMVEQQLPVRRRVALKVIKLGMDTKNVIARFEAERQALALMDHPNIAKVLDAGATEKGRPYFVMELVKGIRITDYCDQNNLSTGDRLKLFVQVCQAVQHAHQKGIIHRDLKPSNILIADHDGVPVPKIIDFGIAKATTDQRLTDKTLFTAFEQSIGTPAYMSPEQAKLSGLDIDTRSDIYSLGVLLYELLTGKTPFDSKRLLDAGLDEVRRIIREEDPPRPSTRLSSTDAAEQTKVARYRHSEPPKLLRLIRGDLDWIVMKTLEKDRNRRYETANGLAADIKRFLNNDPVAARPPSNIYQFQKMVRRNKLAFGATTAVAISLLLGIVASTWLYLRTRDAEHNALNQASRAEASKAEAEALRQTALNEARRAEASKAEAESLRRSSDSALTFLKNALYSADSYNVRDQTLNFDFLFRSAESNLDSIASDPRATAVAQSALGRIASNWGRYEQAKIWLERSVEFWRELEKNSETESRKEAGLELAEVLNYLAWATVGDQENNNNLNERARQGVSFAKQAFEKRRALTTPNGDRTLCLQADWLRLRQLAGDPDLGVFLAFMDYLAAWAGQSREQFRDSLSSAIVGAVRLADAGNRKDAHQRIREFNEPLFDPKTRAASRIRLPRALANAGERIREPSKLPPAVGAFLHLNNHELEVSGTLLIEVATQLGAEMLPAGHPDLKAIARLAMTPEKKAGL